MDAVKSPMASAVASTSAYVFPAAHEPPPPPPAPPVQPHQHQPAPSTTPPAAAVQEDSEVSDYQGDSDGDDEDDDDDDDQLSDGERSDRKRRKKELDGVTLGSGDSPGLSGGRLKRYLCPHPGCHKCYTRPIRLEEHVRSHTGEVSVSASPSPHSHLL